jgi:hypothetical protein
MQRPRRRCKTAAVAARPRAALRRLGGTAAAPRELPGAAGGTPEVHAPPAAPAGPGPLADAVPDAPPRRDRRTGRRAAAAPALRPRRLHADLERAPAPPGSALGEDDEEKLLDTLRHAHHAEVFRTLVRDVEGELTVEQVADDLSALADTLLDTALRWAWSRLKQRHRDVPGLAVIAYGKLGGKELGYGSDLDVVFLYDDPTSPTGARAGGLRRLRAQADHLADAAHRRRRAVRHRHRAAAQRQFGPAGDRSIQLRALPGRPRQQHRLDLGTPGADAGALCRRRTRVAARFEATRRAVLTAERDPPRCAKRCARCARRCARRARCAPAAST